MKSAPKHSKPTDSAWRSWIAAVLLGAAIGASAAASIAQPIIPDASLKAFIREALDNNPDLESWRYKVEQFDLRITQAGAWDDPMITLGLMNVPVGTFDLDQEPMTAMWLTINQSIPTFGKQWVKKSIAEAMSERAQSGSSVRRLAIVQAIGEAWFDWAFLKYSAAIVDTTVGLFDDLVRVTATKYETGSALQQDLLRTQTERARLLDKWEWLGQMSLTVGRRFAVLLGRSPDQFPSPPENLPEDFSPLDSAALTVDLLAQNPMLRLRGADIVIAARKWDLVRRMWYPDLKIGLGYGFRKNAPTGMVRPDFLTVTAGASTPVFGKWKQGPAVQEAAISKREAESALQDTRLQLQFRLAQLMDEDARLARQITLYQQEIIPQAKASVAASTAAYVVGKMGIESLIMAETALYHSRIEALTRVRDRQKARVEISALTGGQAFIGE